MLPSGIKNKLLTKTDQFCTAQQQIEKRSVLAKRLRLRLPEQSWVLVMRKEKWNNSVFTKEYNF